MCVNDGALDDYNIPWHWSLISSIDHLGHPHILNVFQPFFATRKHFQLSCCLMIVERKHAQPNSFVPHFQENDVFIDANQNLRWFTHKVQVNTIVNIDKKSTYFKMRVRTQALCKLQKVLSYVEWSICLGCCHFGVGHNINSCYNLMLMYNM